MVSTGVTEKESSPAGKRRIETANGGGHYATQDHDLGGCGISYRSRLGSLTCPIVFASVYFHFAPCTGVWLQMLPLTL
jgi:hypothetical protein